jgi:hypothetical protein
MLSSNSIRRRTKCYQDAGQQIEFVHNLHLSYLLKNSYPFIRAELRKGYTRYIKENKCNNISEGDS